MQDSARNAESITGRLAEDDPVVAARFLLPCDLNTVCALKSSPPKIANPVINAGHVTCKATRKRAKTGARVIIFADTNTTIQNPEFALLFS